LPPRAKGLQDRRCKSSSIDASRRLVEDDSPICRFHDDRVCGRRRHRRAQKRAVRVAPRSPEKRTRFRRAGPRRPRTRMLAEPRNVPPRRTMSRVGPVQARSVCPYSTGSPEFGENARRIGRRVERCCGRAGKAALRASFMGLTPRILLLEMAPNRASPACASFARGAVRYESRP